MAGDPVSVVLGEHWADIGGCSTATAGSPKKNGGRRLSKRTALELNLAAGYGNVGVVDAALPIHQTDDLYVPVWLHPMALLSVEQVLERQGRGDLRREIVACVRRGAGAMPLVAALQFGPCMWAVLSSPRAEQALTMRPTGSRFQTPSSAAAVAAKVKRPVNGPPPSDKNRRKNIKTTAPLYLQVANHLIDGIQSGNFPVGSLLPTEIELATINRVSRQTVRHAIAELRQKGLVSARKGVGTRVESVKAARRFNYSAQSVADLFTMAAETEMTVEARAMIIARGKVAAQLGCRSGHRWLHLGCLRTIANERRPLCWTDIFVDGRLAGIVRTLSVFRSAVFALIEKEAGESVTEIQQEIRAVMLSDAHAQRIDAIPGTPALEITRRYFSTGRRLIQVSVNTVPSDRYFYSVEILRQKVGEVGDGHRHA